MIQGEEVEIDIEPINVMETGVDGNNNIGTVDNLNETANNNNIDTQDGMDEEPNNLEANYIKLLRD